MEGVGGFRALVRAGELAGGRASWGRISHTAFGRNRNPEESRVNTGIPVPQKFLQKNSVKAAENRNLCDPSPKPRSCEKFLRKTQGKKEILRNPVRNGVLGPKNKFLKIGIGNLDSDR